MSVKKAIVTCLVVLFGTSVQAQFIGLEPDTQKKAEAAQALVVATQYAPALTALDALKDRFSNLDGANRLFYERLVMATAIETQRWSSALTALDYLLADKSLAVPERNKLLQTAASVAQNAKDTNRALGYARAIVAANIATDRHKTYILQTLLAANQFDAILAEVQQWPASNTQVSTGFDAALDGKPYLNALNEDQLKIVALSYSKLKQRAAYGDTLKLLLLRYPSKDYWADVLTELVRQKTFSPRLHLDIYRLLELTDNLEEADDYLDIANLAVKQGLPHDAKRILDAGFKAKILGVGEQAKSHQALAISVGEKVRDDDAALAASSKSSSNTANGFAQLGDVAVSKRDWVSAAKVYQQAFNASIKPNELRRPEEVQLHWGIATLMSQGADAAAPMFAKLADITDPAVKTSAQLTAQLWLHYFKTKP